MSKEQTKVRPSPFWFIVLSSVYVLGTLIAIWRNWTQMVAMSPSEWGDVAAGVFSPLAFLWFLYTALAQRAELRLQHEELQQNTKAQQDQEQQMQRQANALDAQVKRLEAQAAAEYAPILVLKTSSLGPMLGDVASTSLVIRNHGTAVLDVVAGGGSKMHGLIGNLADFSVIRGSVLPHWPKNFDLELYVPERAPPGQGLAEDLEFELTVTRLDLQTFTHRYLYLHAEQRIALIEVAPANRPMPPMGHSHPAPPTA